MLPDVTSSFPIAANLTVNDEVVPLGGCEETCPIYLEKLSENFYQIVGFIKKIDGREL